MRLQPITGPRRAETTGIRLASASIAAGSTEPSVRIACPVIWSGTAAPKNSRIVGAMSVEAT